MIDVDVSSVKAIAVLIGSVSLALIGCWLSDEIVVRWRERKDRK